MHWHPGIGDPSFMGWLTVICYFVAAFFAFKLYLKSEQLFISSVSKQKSFWLIIALAMLLLGVNKQLDIQSLLTEIGKYYAHRDGWYENRRVIQVGLIGVILLSVTVLTIWFSISMRMLIRTNWLAIVGLIFLLIFVMIRATSFHHMDILINTTFLGVKLNWVFELSGIFCIAYSALSLLQKSSKRQH